MAALSAVVLTLSGWLGLYLLARDPRKPVLALAATGLCGFALVATLFFALGNAILIIPLGLLPSWLALASTGFDLLLGVAVALWDAFDEGQALRADMLRSFAGSMAVAVLFGAQALVGLAVTRHDAAAQAPLTVLLFTTLAVAVAVQVLADPFAGALDRLAFSKSPALRADRAALGHTGAALPLRSDDPLRDIQAVDDETFVRLTRRALGHYGDLTKLVASPLTGLPVIDERLAARGAADHPLERANELEAVLADAIGRLKPRDAGDFGTTEQWRHYNSL